MRKVKIVKGMAGKGYTFQAGSVVDLPDSIAARYVDWGVAIWDSEPSDPVEDATDTSIEVDVEVDVEIAATPAKRARKGRSRKPKNAEKR